MIISRVIGTVVATRKLDLLVGTKILVVQTLDPGSEIPRGDPFVAVDAVGAGVGEKVIVVEGSAARIALGEERSPVDATIVGIVDEIDVR